MLRSYFCKFKGASIALGEVPVEEEGATISTEVASLRTPVVVELEGGQYELSGDINMMVSGCVYAAG